ncbi:YbaK/EbsC family protein [Liquorilactobacillus sicerae]|uniref:YbaK/EbsC family protein n=1 Tax=Liquorilactobacillus sicerae TaxID=1416943 RepID=UPI0024818872|nr:YbaK/EbsC family protein [Liquorilactobacillus sicerae]
MSFAKVKAYFESQQLADKLFRLPASGATVAEAAETLDILPEQVAKTLAFKVNGQPLVVVMAGDARIDNHNFKSEFGARPRMIPADQVNGLIGHEVGGVCPFALNSGVDVYIDQSLENDPEVFPAAGDQFHAARLTLPELLSLSHYQRWVKVTK